MGSITSDTTDAIPAVSTGTGIWIAEPSTAKLGFGSHECVLSVVSGIRECDERDA